MYTKKGKEDTRCPLEYGLKQIGGKWKSRVVCLLGNVGPMRFGELKSDLVDITDGVLSSTINELTAGGLIEKVDCVQPGVPSYRITEKGQSLLPVLQELCKWSSPYYLQNNGIIMGHCLQCEFYKSLAEEPSQTEAT